MLQNGQTTKGHELLQLKSDYREIREKLSMRDDEIIDLKKCSIEKDNEIAKLRTQLKRLSLQAATDVKLDSMVMQNSDYIDTKSNSNFNVHHAFSNLSLNDYNSLEIERDDCTKEETEEDIEVRSINSIKMGTLHNCREVEKLRDELNIRKKDFEREKAIWAHEKEKVLKYQRQLQMNYVQMYRKTRTLETELENVRANLELLDAKKKSQSNELNQTVEL